MDPKRCHIGSKEVTNVEWKCLNIFGDQFLESFVIGRKKFDFVISNPSFDLAMATFVLASELVTKQGTIAFILPSDFFQRSQKIQDLFELVPLTILSEIKLGKEPYYSDTSKTRRYDDSIFVFKLSSDTCRLKKWSYVVKATPTWYLKAKADFKPPALPQH